MRVAICLLAPVLLTCGVHAQSADVPAVTYPMERVEVTPLSFERAFAEFRAICMDAVAGAEAFEAAVEGSDFDYELVPERPASEPLWTSRRGKVGYSVERLEDGRAASECVFRVFVAEASSRDALIETIGDALAPSRPRSTNPFVAHWDFGSGSDAGLYHYMPSKDVRYLELNWRRVLPEQAD